MAAAGAAARLTVRFFFAGRVRGRGRVLRAVSRVALRDCACAVAASDVSGDDARHALTASAHRASERTTVMRERKATRVPTDEVT